MVTTDCPHHRLSCHHDYPAQARRRRHLLRTPRPLPRPAAPPALPGPVARRANRWATPATGNASGARSAARPRPPSWTSSATCTPSSTHGITPKPGYTHYTVRQAAEDWLAHGLEGRSPKTITKNQNVLEPILTVIGARKLRDLTAADVRQALAAMAAGYSTAAVSMGHLALKRAIRHAEASDLVSRNVAILADTPKGQQGRPSKSLTLDQALAVIDRRGDPAGDGTAARPERCPPPGGADARLHRAEPAVRAPHRGSPGAALGARRPGRRPGRPPARPAAHSRLAIGPRPRRDQDRTVPPHPRPPRRRCRGAARLVRQPGRRTARSRRRLAGHRARVHEPRGRRAGRGQRPQDVQAHLHRGRRRGQLDPARTAHHLRQPDEPPGSQPSRKSPAWPGTPPPAPPRSSTAANYAPSSPPAPRSWTSSSRQPRLAPPSRRRPDTRQPPISGYLIRTRYHQPTSNSIQPIRQAITQRDPSANRHPGQTPHKAESGGPIAVVFMPTSASRTTDYGFHMPPVRAVGTGRPVTVAVRAVPLRGMPGV